MTRADLVIAVTGMNSGESPQPGPAVAKSLREAKDFGGRIVGLIYDAMESGVYLDGLIDAAYLVPYPSSGTEQLFERLEEIIRKENIGVIIPTLDAELSAYQRLESRLNRLGVKLFLPTDDQLQARSKARLPELAKSLDVAMPRQKLVATFEELTRSFSEFEAPLVVKGIYYEAGIANDAWEAERIARKIAHKWGWPIIVQEKIVGEEYDLAMLGDGAGGGIGSVAIKKMSLTDKGKAFSGMTISDEAILDIGERFLARTKWRGALELEFVKETTSETYYLIEVNPRFPAWIYLAAGLGQNMAWAYARLALGESCGVFTPAAAGVFFVRHATDLVADISKLEKLAVDGELRL